MVSRYPRSTSARREPEFRPSQVLSEHSESDAECSLKRMANRELRKSYPDYSCKEATLNPTNPRDRATDWDADIVNRFRQVAIEKEIVAGRDSPTGRQLYITRAIRITNPECLQCRTTAEASPPSTLKIYGSANGFGGKLNEVVGAQVVTAPMEVPRRNADRAAFFADVKAKVRR